MKHNQLVPYAAALAAFVAIGFLALAAGGMETARHDIDDRVLAARFAQEVLTESNALLLALNKSQRPSCDEANLRVLRQIEYRHAYVNDIGIVDDANHVICTTTLGILNPKMDAITPEFSIISGGEKIYITDHAKDYIAHEGRPISRARLNQFQITISPHAIERMRAARFSAVGYIGEDKRLRFIRGTLKDNGAVSDIHELTSSDVDWSKNRQQWSWRHLALEMSFNVKDLPFVYYHRSPVFSGSATSLEYKLFALLAAFVLAMVVHALVGNAMEKSSEMSNRIKRLLTADNLRCVYQPIVSLDSGRIVGCEVLVRLQDGDTLRTPDQFLPAVLERHLAWRLDRLVIQNSLTDLLAKIPADEPFEVALNVFPQNIKAEQLHALIHKELGWNPKADFTINIEVVEHAYHDEMLIEIAELKRLGYRVCVDDFGTGFSNLGSVRKLRPNFLKIDRSFVHEMEAASVRSSLIPEIVAIARATGAALIAEGIENEQQRDALRGLGVEFGQGYFLGRPMALPLLIARMQEQPKKVVDLADWRNQEAS